MPLFWKSIGLKQSMVSMTICPQKWAWDQHLNLSLIRNVSFWRVVWKWLLLQESMNWSHDICDDFSDLSIRKQGGTDLS